MSDTPETDSYANRDWWTLFRANEHARELERERDEARNKMADALQEVDLRILCVDRMNQECYELRKELEEYRSIAENIEAVKAVSEKEKAICERNEALNKMADALQEVDLRTLDYERMKQERDEALILGNNLADECERILGLGLHQNTIKRFKAALEAWKNYNNE